MLEHGGPEVAPRLIDASLLELLLHRILVRPMLSLLLTLQEPLLVQVRNVSVLIFVVLLFDHRDEFLDQIATVSVPEQPLLSDEVSIDVWERNIVIADLAIDIGLPPVEEELRV